MLKPTEHQCAWRDEALALRTVVAEQAQIIAEQGRVIAEHQQKIEALLAQMQSLERRILGPKSEKMPSPAKEVTVALPPVAGRSLADYAFVIDGGAS